MTILIVGLTLLIAGIFAGLIQYFVDFKGLPIFQPQNQITESLVQGAKPGFLTRLVDFFRRHWQLLGYLIIGIAGAYLVPLFAKLAKLPAIKYDFSCLGQENCTANGWDVFVLLGYGIISGYSSVRLIRSVGSLLLGNISTVFTAQQQSMGDLKKQIEELNTKVTALPKPPVQTLTGTPSLPQLEMAFQQTDYFNEAQNEAEKRAYYAGTNLQDKNNLFEKLNNLLTTTHTRPLNYKPARHLYPLVDLHPDNLLHSVYFPDKTFDSATLIAMDEMIDQLRENERASFDCLEMSAAEHQWELEKKFPYNCEHVMPQSWFNEREPMRGDLHHLFTCEIDCNSFRGNFPYYDFAGFGFNELDRPKCGRVEEVPAVNRTCFEPQVNKGVVARAVLYFLVRYPGAIGTGKYSDRDITMFVNWHNNNKPTMYEWHRNVNIYKAQGNRNPFIDFPELVGSVDFMQSFKTASLLEAFSLTTSPDDEKALSEFHLETTFAQACLENKNDKWNKWRVAESLKTLIRNVNTLAPGRKKGSDGAIGDAAHQTRSSDHNPWIWDEATKKGIVTALDVTHDPNGKCDCHILVDSLVNNKDGRLKYIIWNKRIINSSPINGTAAWTWRPYTGTNPHNKHVHISVKCNKELYDEVNDWTIDLS